MRKFLSLVFLAGLMLLPSCGIYKKYQGVNIADADTVVVDIPSWKEYFTDPLLQELIDTALVRNTSVAVASIRLRQADESLKASKLAYIPSLAFSPVGGMSFLPGPSPSYSYNLPVNASWNYGSPGSLFAKRYQAHARRIQAEDNLEAARNGIISQVAADYYMLQMLDRKVDILENTIKRWSATMSLQKKIFEAGNTLYSSVAQMESSIMDASQELLDIKADIVTLERSLCLILAKPYSQIKRSQACSSSDVKPLPIDSVSVAQLRLRPDVRAAERDMEICFYLTSEAISAFYPSISINLLGGWPAALNAALSLVQPIFAQGTLRSRYRISKMDQEIALDQYRQILLQASSEVYQALADYKLYSDKQILYARQRDILGQSVQIQENLLGAGMVNYLEIVKSQEDWLEAQIGECESVYKQQEASIMLFKALANKN